MKKIALLLLLCLIVSAIPFNSVIADPPLNPSGGTILGNMVFWENEIARLEVWPHTSTELVKHTQYANLTWKYPSMDIDIAFRFGQLLQSYNDIWLWKNVNHPYKEYEYGNVESDYTIINIESFQAINQPDYVDFGDIPSDNYYNGTLVNGTSYNLGFDTFDWLNPEQTNAIFYYNIWGVTGWHWADNYYYDWDSIKSMFNYQEFNGKHYYYVKDFSAAQSQTYNLKWTYSIPVVDGSSNGKWELLAKRSSDTIQEALSNGSYCMLDPWWNTNWEFRRDIYIQNSYIDATLTDFPVLINISDAIADKMDGGASLRFVNTLNDTVFNYQMDTWTDGSERLVWVAVDSVSNSALTHFNMYYGNTGAGNASTNAVWDANYLGVYHLHDSGATAIDYTSGGNNGTYQGSLSTPVSGICGNGQDLDGNGDYISLPTGAFIQNAGTFEIYYEADGTGATDVMWNNKQDADDYFAVILFTSPTDYDAVYKRQNVNQMDINGGDLSTNWVRLFAVAATNDGALRVDTTSIGTDSSITEGGWSFSSIDVGADTGGGTECDGIIDELRISDSRRSNAWSDACYDNIFNYDTFIIMGAEIIGNSLPVITNPIPVNASTGAARPPELNITVSDANSDTMTLTWYSNSSGSWAAFGYNNSVLDGSYTQTNNNLSASNTTYWWNVSVDDGTNFNDSGIYHFTTLEGVDKPTLFAGNCANETNWIGLTWTIGVNSTHTRIQRRTDANPTSISDGTNIYNASGDQKVDTATSAGLTYYYSTWAYNSTLNEWSNTYESIDIATRPLVPDSFSATTVDNQSISLTWTKGNGADNTTIRYKTGTYPASPTDGTEATNTTGTSTTLSGLNAATTYFFRAWSYNDTVNLLSFYYANDTATTNWQPSNATNLIAGIYDHDQHNLTWVSGNGTATVVCRKTVSYPANYDDGTKIFNSTGASYVSTGLSASTQYFYRAWAWNNTLNVYSIGFSFATNYTRPGLAQNMTGTAFNSTCVNFSWDSATGADNYTMTRKAASYPTSRADGTEICNTSLLYFNDTGYTSGDYYSIWSWNSTSNLYSLLLQVEWGGLSVSTFNETDGTAITGWTIFITNASGSETYEATNQNNGASFAINNVPYGDQTVIIINATDYRSRIYYMDIDVNEQYTLNAYLPGTTESNLYYITVSNNYDEPVGDAAITFRKSISGSYVNTSRLYTNSEGQVNLYFIPGTLIKVTIEASGYIATYDDFTPDPEYYGIYYPVPFTLEFDETGPLAKTFGELIHITAGWETNGTMRITYNDLDINTSDVWIRVFESYNGTLNMNYSANWSANTVTAWVEGLNTSRMHEVRFYINHSTLGTIDNYTIVVMPLRATSYDEDYLEDRIAGPFGEFELGYVNMFIIWGPSMGILLGLAALGHPGAGIIGSALYYVAITWQLDAAVATELGILISLLLVMGALVIAINKKNNKGG